MPEKFLGFPFEVKQLEDSGSFEGLASVYGNVDLGGDIVERGAFKEIMTTRDGSIRVLDAHNTRAPVGKGTLTDTPDGLRIRGQLDLQVGRARELLSLLKKGILEGLSIGFDILPGGAEVRNDGVRLLRALKLWEVSLVAFPMNPAAQVAAVKDVTACNTAEQWNSLLRAHGASKRKARAAAIAILSNSTGGLDIEDIEDGFANITQDYRGY
jgi:HK97 family phage prohead protease